MSKLVVSPEVQARKTALLYRNAAFGQLVNISVSALVAFIGYISRPGPIILVWWLLMLGLAVVRYQMARSYAAAQPGPAESETWSARYVRTTALSSLLWLLGGGLIMWGNSDGYRFLTGLALAGMVAGAVPVLSAVKVAFRAYAIPILGGVALISFAGATTPVDWAFGLMALVFLAGVLRSADFLHDALAESMALGLDLETTGDGYWRISNDGRLVDVNSAYCRYSGYTREELLKMKFSDLEEAGASASTAAHLRNILETGSALFETRHRRKDGSLWQVEIRATASKASDVSFSVFLRDITERKVFERKLLNSRDLLRQFLDRFPGTAYLKDAQSRVLLANMGFKTLHGLDPVAMVGRRSDEVFGGEFGRKIVVDDRRIIEAGRTEVIEEALGGRYFESIKFVIMQGEERLLGGITVDVTPRVRSRMRTEALMALTERGGVLEERELLRFGLEKAEEITSSAIGFLHFVNEDQESIELGTWTEGALKGCKAVHDKHYPISGAGIWADCFRRREAAIFNDYEGYVAKMGLPPGHAKLDRLISVPVLDEGKVRMMLGVGNKASDYDEFDVQSLQLIGNDLWRIVRRARAEQALKDRLEEITALNRKLEQSQGQLLQSEKMATIGQLAAGVAHELNNPIGFVQSNLGTLSGYVGNLLEIVAHSEQCAEHCSVPGHLDSLRRIMEQKDFDFLKDDVRQLLAESKDGADRVRRIVQNLKDFSHVSEDEWQWADLQKGLESTLTLVWNEIKYKAEVEKNYGELPEVFCVASQLNQVFMNLLVNAAQAIETRGKISIATGVLPSAAEDEAKVWIEIRDSGKGIAEENLKRIFDPFFTTKPVGKGTGLGLSLAWSIVQKHRGSIDVQSVLGEGSTFRLTLPVNANPDTKEATT